ncbi:MAG: hypothetical protein ABR600_08660 [Actinomycetota bacterium]
MLRPSSPRLRARGWLSAVAVPLMAFVLALPTPSSGQTADPAGAPGAPSAPPDSHKQPLADGCQRSNGMQLTLTTPEWVYVNRASVLQARAAGDTTAGRQSVEGVVADIHPAGDDLFVNHDYNDVDIDVHPDAPYTNLPATGNGGGNIGTEWEGALMPQWAWPQVGDRVRESGSWIWDCGHWGNGPADDTFGVSQLLPYDPEETLKDLASPGTIRGEQTELHPLYEVATFRKNAAGRLGDHAEGRELQHVDVWINGDGGPALSEEECSLFGLPSAAAAFPQACPRYRDVGGTYTYTLDLGPQAGVMVVNPVVVHPETDEALRSIPVHIEKKNDAGTVTVSFTLPHSTAPQHFGISVEAGWNHAPLAVHHTVRLESLTVNATLDGPTEPSINPVPVPQDPNGPVREQTPDPGEWVMYAAANGHWWQIDPALLGQVTAHTTLPLNHTFDYWLPAGVAPTLYVSGRECDIPLIDCTKDRYGAPPTDRSDPFQEVGYNDKPGRIELGNTGLPLKPGSATYAPIANPVPGTTSEDYSDTTCGGPCYSVKATSS